MARDSLAIMAQILDPLPSDSQDYVVCCYVNATSKVQVVRIMNIPNWYFERVVFPGQRLMFESLSEALLEIHSGMMASAILSDTIPCDRLRIDLPVPPAREGKSINNNQSSQTMPKNKEKITHWRIPTLATVD